MDKNYSYWTVPCNDQWKEAVEDEEMGEHGIVH